MEKTRANQLQFLRFIAFLLICMVHTESYQPSWGPGGNGAINAVAFFIILSGAVSGYSSYNKDIECSFKGILLYMWKKIKKGVDKITLFCIIISVRCGVNTTS